MMGGSARRSLWEFSNPVRLLPRDFHIFFVSNTNALFKACRCPSCDNFISRTGNLERNLTTCNERVEHVFPKNGYQEQETLIDKSDSFNIPYFDDQKLFKNTAMFDFESICEQKDKFCDTDTTIWTGKHVPISASASSKLIEQPIFLCPSNP